MDRWESWDDQEMILRMRNGEFKDQITEYLMRKYKPMVRKKAHVLYLAGGETEDLIQEGMLGLFKALRDFDPVKKASFATFAGLCIDRQMYKAIQHSNRQKNHVLNTSLSLDDYSQKLESSSSENPETILIDLESAQGTEEKIRARLSDFENIVLSAYLEGNDYIKISEKTGKSPKSIDNALQRIRKKVKETV